MTGNAARLVEGYFTKWLRHDEIGKKQVAELGFDGAMDALFELLNAGFIKLQQDGLKITGIAFCNPPRPPAETLARPRKQTRKIDP